MSPDRTAAAVPADGSGFRPDVQGLRGLAVLLVVVFHTGLALPGGFVGVDVFFVISGFVISRLLITELDTEGRLDLRRFYRRRARRLLPALALAVAVVLAMSALLAPIGSQAQTARTGIAAALFVANFYLARATDTGYFGTDAAWNPLLHTWSLSVEEQFYVVAPALLAVSWWLARRSGRFTGRQVALVVFGALSVVSFGLGVILVRDSAARRRPRSPSTARPPGCGSSPPVSSSASSDVRSGVVVRRCWAPWAWRSWPWRHWRSATAPPSPAWPRCCRWAAPSCS
jgi:peptidoglycan/LPS O-acetylase OafA/YrhL